MRPHRLPGLSHQHRIDPNQREELFAKYGDLSKPSLVPAHISALAAAVPRTLERAPLPPRARDDAGEYVPRRQCSFQDAPAYDGNAGVEFRGHSANLREQLSSVDILLQPRPRGETVGIVNAEASNAGCVVLATMLLLALAAPRSSSSSVVPPGATLATRSDLRSLLRLSRSDLRASTGVAVPSSAFSIESL